MSCVGCSRDPCKEDPGSADDAPSGGTAAECSRGVEAEPRTASRAATVNPCTLCAPLGAVLAAAGVSRGIALLHGAQGCATYIRRYLISHFREPVDVASSAFGETQTVFGGEDNLGRALDNITKQYAPELVIVGTTCVAETIGEDMGRLLTNHRERTGSTLPVVHVSTPSYKLGHVEGFHAAVLSMVETLATEEGAAEPRLNLLPPIISPADIRHLRELVESFGTALTVLPDYSDTLDGPIHATYHALPQGGTALGDIRATGRSRATLDLTLPGRARCAGGWLEARGVRRHVLGLPVGVCATDAFIEAVGAETGRVPASWIEAERGRLLDAYADGHKYVFGKRVAVYGDPELTVAVAGFLLEMGAVPVLLATGARNRALSMAQSDRFPSAALEVLEDTDFGTIEAACERIRPDLLIGSSKGYRIARRLGIPLLRLGFPIHDRVGAARVLSVGYRGSLALMDQLVNLLMARQQDASPVGFSYL